MKSFIKWIGGKSLLMDELKRYLPQELPCNYTYHEPFLGSGSMFFHLTPSKAILTDINKSLIECYEEIRDKPYKVYDITTNLKEKDSEKNYYKARKKFNENNINKIEKAAIFIYLNKSCFNGIYRENKNGKFNRAYGDIHDSGCQLKSRPV